MDLTEISNQIRNALEIKQTLKQSTYKSQKKTEREIQNLQRSIANLEIYQKLKVGDWVTKGEEVGEIRDLNLSPGGMPVVWVQWVSAPTEMQRLLPEQPDSFKLLGDNWNLETKLGQIFKEGKIIGFAWSEKHHNSQAIVEVNGIISCIALKHLISCRVKCT